MEEITKHQPGSFCWIELGTTNCKETTKFYCDLFNWTVDPEPLGNGKYYNMLFLDGKVVGASYELSEQQKEQNVPPHWLPYVAVEDACDIAQRTKELSGQTIVDCSPVFDNGKLSILQDPNGALFAVWEAQNHIGSKIRNVPGSYCWVELGTNDLVSSKTFYSRLFNWGIKDDNFDGLEYTTFKNGPISEAGMYKFPAELAELPPHWLVYFDVADCDVTVELARSLGAQVLKGPESINRVGRFAVMKDPSGAVFAVIKLEMP